MNTQLTTAAPQRWKTLTIVAALLIGGLPPVRPAWADINEQVAQLDLGRATLKDVTPDLRRTPELCLGGQDPHPG